MTPDAPHVRLHEQVLLSDDWGILKKTRYELRRRDGRWQSAWRETYDRGHGAVVLVIDRERGCVVLTRQFRLPVYVAGSNDGMLVEACAGLLDGDDAEACIRREAEEETGLRLRAPRKLFEAWMSPGSVTERLHFFVAEVERDDHVHAGGGCADEGEDIEVVELPFDVAWRMLREGRFEDAKTIMLLQHAALAGWLGPRA